MRKILTTLLLSACLHIPALAVYANETPSGIPFSQLESRIDEVVARYLHQTTPGVAIVVVKDGEIVFSRGYGYADIENRTPVDPATTVFEYGSVGKLFVWTAVMQLAEQGRLDLDADIRTYLPEDFIRRLNFGRTFTMRDLMNHSAGFADNFFDILLDAERVRNPGTLTLREGLLRGQPRQVFEPGTASAYSNFGSALAGYVVGHITGHGFVAYERENIFAPLGMTNTKNQPDLVNNRAFLGSKAGGYFPDGRGGFRRGVWSYGPMYPAGLVNGTAKDLARFAIALTPPHGTPSPLFNDPSTLTTMFTPSTLDPSVLRGTYHGFLRYGGASPTFGHGGNTIAFSANFAVVPAERFGFVVLTNVASEMGVLFAIQDLLLGSSPITPIADNLPCASSVEGTFVMARRTEGTLLEFVSYLGMMGRVRAVDENTIRLSVGPFEARSRQIEPYVFRMIPSASPLSMFADEIHFRMENGRVVHVSVGNGFDMTPLPRGRGMPALIGSLAVVIISTLFFLIMPIIILIRFLRKKEKAVPQFNLLSNGLLLCGTLIVLNNLICLVRLAVINNYRSFLEIVPHVWVNYALLAFASLLFLASLLSLPGNKIGGKRKFLHGATASVMTLLIVVLGSWNFFALG